jgi:hypothetical protein
MGNTSGRESVKHTGRRRHHHHTFKKHRGFKTRRYHKHKRYYGGIHSLSKVESHLKSSSEIRRENEQESASGIVETGTRTIVKPNKLTKKRDALARGPKVKNLTIHAHRIKAEGTRLDQEEARERARLSREAEASPGTPRPRSPGKSADAEVALIKKAREGKKKADKERKEKINELNKERDSGPKSNPLFKSRSRSGFSTSKLDPMILEEEE